MLQQLPKQLVPDETVRFDQWQTLCALADTVTTDELLTIDTDRLLYRLFNEWTVKRFEPKGIRFDATARASEALTPSAYYPNTRSLSSSKSKKQ